MRCNALLCDPACHWHTPPPSRKQAECKASGHNQKKTGRQRAREVCPARCRDTDVTDAIGELDDDPHGGCDLTSNATGANRTNIAPRANPNERSVDDGKPQRQICADKSTDESRWSKYLEEPRHILLHGVCRLSDHQDEEQQFAAWTHRLVA